MESLASKNEGQELTSKEYEWLDVVGSVRKQVNVTEWVIWYFFPDQKESEKLTGFR